MIVFGIEVQILFYTVAVSSFIFDKTPTYAELASVTGENGHNTWDLTGINELFRIKKDSSTIDESLLVPRS